MFFGCVRFVAAFTTISDAHGEWRDNTIWQGGVAPLYTVGNNQSVVVNGNVSVHSSLQFNNGASLVISSGATFVVVGDISFNNNASISISNDAVFVVFGSFSTNNNMTIGVNGKVVVFENFSVGNGASVDIPNENSMYVFGEFSSGNNTSFPNASDFGDFDSFLSGEPDIIDWLNDEYATGLPIELSSFTVFCTPRGVQFGWVTEAEINNDFFTLEYSENGIDFYPITVLSGVGNSSIRTEYEYFDDAPRYSGLVYFRLKQTDYDGTFSYSHILSVLVPNMNIDIFIFPNPATDFIVIQDNYSAVQSYSVYCAQFREVLFGSQAGKLDVTNLSPGVYFVEIRTANSRISKEFIKK